MKTPSEKPLKLKHGEITGYYVKVYDQHIRGEILIPVTHLDIVKKVVRLP